MEWYPIIIKAFWCGFAALGFGVLFNAPARALLPVWIGGFIAGMIKFSMMYPAVGAGVVISSFAAAVMVGVVSIPIAHLRHVTPTIFAIPSVIPLVPGVFAYRTMLGMMMLIKNPGSEQPGLLSDTVYNGLITFFIIMVLSLGVAVPMLVIRKDSVKNIRLKPLTGRKDEPGKK
jgi:uncharacterized membrane protein YjjB (DUF3815 family)